MKDVFENAFNRQKNYNQILKVVAESNQTKSRALPRYAVALSAITLACVVGKIWINAKKLN